MSGVVVLGLGNVLLTDDGVGVAAIEALERAFAMPDDVSVLDGGTLGLSLLGYLEGVRALILVDAVRAEGEPGTLVRFDGEDVLPAAAHRLSPHQVGVADLLDAARMIGSLPAEVVLLGVVPERIELGVELTPAVRAQVEALAESVAVELARMGSRPSRREVGADPAAAVGATAAAVEAAS